MSYVNTDMKSGMSAIENISKPQFKNLWFIISTDQQPSLVVYTHKISVKTHNIF
jgi:hypothetical protein